jgi:hypothetical protein
MSRLGFACPRPRTRFRGTLHHIGSQHVRGRPLTVAAPATAEMRPLQIAASLIGMVVVLLALPVVIIAGGPFGGWLLGAALWLANWGLMVGTMRFATGIQSTMAVGMMGISFIARAWLIAGVLFVVALRFSEPVALTAAGVFIFAFTFDLIGRAVVFSLKEKMRAAEAGE